VAAAAAVEALLFAEAVAVALVDVLEVDKVSSVAAVVDVSLPVLMAVITLEFILVAVVMVEEAAEVAVVVVEEAADAADEAAAPYFQQPGPGLSPQHPFVSG